MSGSAWAICSEPQRVNNVDWRRFRALQTAQPPVLEPNGSFGRSTTSAQVPLQQWQLESDNLIKVKEISATDAARRFSALLDAVEHGETFVVTRGGKGVARIEPTIGVTGAAVKALLRRHRIDPAWRDELRDLRADTPAQDRTWRD
jgi:prevent-host-death family protein